MRQENQVQQRAIRTGLKLLLVTVALVVGQAALPIFRADAGDLDQVATTRHGLVASPAFGLSELTPFPNPARLYSRIRYKLNTAANSVTIKIYEPTGRLIRTLPGSTTAGTNTVSWDLTNNAGTSVACGVYLVRVTAAGTGAKTTDQTKIAVIR